MRSCDVGVTIMPQTHRLISHVKYAPFVDVVFFVGCKITVWYPIEKLSCIEYQGSAGISCVKFIPQPDHAHSYSLYVT